MIIKLNSVQFSINLNHDRPEESLLVIQSHQGGRITINSSKTIENMLQSITTLDEKLLDEYYKYGYSVENTDGIVRIEFFERRLFSNVVLAYVDIVAGDIPKIAEIYYNETGVRVIQ